MESYHINISSGHYLALECLKYLHKFIGNIIFFISTNNTLVLGPLILAIVLYLTLCSSRRFCVNASLPRPLIGRSETILYLLYSALFRKVILYYHIRMEFSWRRKQKRINIANLD